MYWLQKLICEDVVIVVIFTERGLSWVVCIDMLKKLLCGHVVILVSFSERESILSAKLLCEDVVIVVILSERGLSWAVCSYASKVAL